MEEMRKEINPSEYAAQLGNLCSKRKCEADKKLQGQFITPAPIAKFLAGLITPPTSSEVSILDPGAGTAILSSAVVEQIIAHGFSGNIKLTCFENDIDILPELNKSLEYLKQWCEGQARLEYKIISEDFLLFLRDPLFRGNEKYDIIVSNPPFFKLGANDPRCNAIPQIKDGQQNIYALFMAQSVTMLKDNIGEMCFITPRSFMSGRYFREMRSYLLMHSSLRYLHSFISRTGVFSEDRILQEIVISKFAKKHGEISISSSFDSKRLDNVNPVHYDTSQIILPKEKGSIIPLPVNAEDSKIMELFSGWTHCLGDFGVRISTGPIVAFRMQEDILPEKEKMSAPLYWLNNVIQMLATHPITNRKKPQYIRISSKTLSALLPNKNYVLLRRFSAKGDKHRLIAAPYFGNQSQDIYVGIENKLNYLYRRDGSLSREEIMGISAMLNSAIFDKYFCIINGNTNVGATELRVMPMPPIEDIKRIGQLVISSNNFSLPTINKIVETILYDK